MERVIRLSHGQLRFSAVERGEGPLVMCLHGFPDHARSFRFQADALSAMGYRVVSPSLRGYEPSSQPRDNDYTLLSVAHDVLAWLDELQVERCHLIGHDWGALVAYVAAALAPERLWSLTTLAIAHPGRLEREALRRRPSQLLKSWYIFFFQLPGVAELALERDDWALIERLWASWSPGFRLSPEELQALKKTFAQPGVKGAALSYYRELFRPFSKPARETRRRLRAPYTIPTLALTGERDGCMDSRLHDVLMYDVDFPAGLRVERLPGVGHFLHQEAPDAVNRLLLDWLASHTPRY
jgi:pimeloyl-ACP methyl ester carboxylesterase